MASNLIKNASVQKTGTVPNGRRETSNAGSKALTFNLSPFFHLTAFLSLFTITN